MDCVKRMLTKTEGFVVILRTNLNSFLDNLLYIRVIKLIAHLNGTIFVVGVVVVVVVVIVVVVLFVFGGRGSFVVVVVLIWFFSCCWVFVVVWLVGFCCSCCFNLVFQLLLVLLLFGWLVFVVVVVLIWFFSCCWVFCCLVGWFLLLLLFVFYRKVSYTPCMFRCSQLVKTRWWQLCHIPPWWGPMSAVPICLYRPPTFLSP